MQAYSALIQSISIISSQKSYARMDLPCSVIVVGVCLRLLRTSHTPIFSSVRMQCTPGTQPVCADQHRISTRCKVQHGVFWTPAQRHACYLAVCMSIANGGRCSAVILALEDSKNRFFYIHTLICMKPCFCIRLVVVQVL